MWQYAHQGINVLWDWQLNMWHYAWLPMHGKEIIMLKLSVNLTCGTMGYIGNGIIDLGFFR